ncbi:MAG TPA: hypothetical protein VG939_05780 [Caulobacteraceae bacterium]|nr:hypothetical protein [Caulobacteraceae bacterium]
MALDGTNAGLIASVNDFLNRSDLTATVPDFIRMAEGQLNRTLRVSDMIKATTLAVSTTSAALPADFLGMVSLELPAGTGHPMRYVRPEEARALRQEQYAAAGTPFAWTIAGGNLETVPAPSGSITCNMLYYQAIPPLATNTAGNWLSIKHPDIYLYGALLQAAPYLKDDARVPVWAGLYQQVVGDLMASDGRTSFGHGLTPPFRAAGAPEPAANP